MLKGKQFGVVAEYSTSSGQKKTIICFDSKSDSVIDVLRDALALCLEHEGKSDVFVGFGIIPTDDYINLILNSESEVK